VPAEEKKSSVNYAAPSLAGGDDEFGKELVNWLFPAYVTLIVLCTFLLLMRGTMPTGQELSPDRAVLTAVNSATLTGLPQRVSPAIFKPFGQFIVLLLTVAGSLFTLIVGGLAVRRILRLPFSDRRIIRAALLCEVIALLIGASGVCGFHVSLLGALSQGAATFGNSGMAAGKPFDVVAWQTHAIVLPMLFLGGLGITVLLELYDWLVHGARLSTHTRTVLAWALGLYAIAVVFLFVLRCIASGIPTDATSFAARLASCSVLAINSRTGGIPFEYAHEYARPVQWTILLLMLIGGAPAGTAGGLKTTTLAVLVSGSRRLLRGDNPGRILGIALAWLGIYLAIAFAGLLMLLFLQPQHAPDQLLFLTISALSNVGLAHDILPDMSRGSYVLAALMLAGRMVPLLILWWIADLNVDTDVAVG
jgi:trk system potassium uptake protein TrkH